MHIANPIYDVVFKYLLEDQKIAKLLISSIIGETIESLEFRPQEHSKRFEAHSFTVYRLDFAATIRTSEGNTKRVLIEIQKAKFATDIMRFRRYLAGEYYMEDFELKKPLDSKEGTRAPIELKDALPIVTIYFLGYRLEHTQAPVIKVERHYYNVVTGEEIHTKEDFIESLTHDSFVIQIPYLKEKRQTELLILLSVFDQSQQTDTAHFLDIQETEFPKKYQAVIRRLQRAMADPEVLETMDLEDEILLELKLKDRAIFQRDQALEDQAKMLEEKDRVLEDQAKEIEALKQQLAQQQSSTK